MTNSVEMPDELELIIQVAAKQICNGVEAADFLRWFKSSVPLIAPEFTKSIDEVDPGSGSLMYLVSRSLWNALPQPSNRYRPKPLPKPSANGRCPCGSGRKFKQCCATAPDMPPLFESLNLLRYVLDYASQATLKTINAGYMDPDALADVTEQWANRGEFNRASLLLLPLFDEGKKLPKQAAFLLDTLLECWPPEHKKQKRLQFCERLSEHSNQAVASVAVQKIIHIYLNKGDVDAAWSRFHTAVRAHPDEVNFAALEIMLLLTSNRRDEAIRRAEFWGHQLRRLGPEYDDYAARILALAESKEDPNQLQDAREQSREIDIFVGIVESEILRFDGYVSAPDDLNQPIMLQPKAKLARVERRWMEVVGATKPMLTSMNSDHDTMPPLELFSAVAENRQCLSSFEALDDLTQSLEMYGQLMPEFNAVLTLLLQRAETLFFGLLTATKPSGAVTAEDWQAVLPSLRQEVPWGVLENRPMLRMMVRHIYYLRNRYAHNEILWLSRAQVVLVLNPNDNHGLRSLVSAELLCLNRPDEALELLNRYPDDGMADSIMNRSLALFCLKRLDDAAKALVGGGARLREIRKGITNQRYAKPRDLDYNAIVMGSREEAWIYREEMRESWLAAGAIDWLKQQSMPRKRKSTTKQTSSEPVSVTDSTIDQSDIEKDEAYPVDFPITTLSSEALRDYLIKAEPHGAWLMGVTLVAAATPGADFAVQRLINPVIERFQSSNWNEEITESEGFEFDEPLINNVLSAYMTLHNHFVSRIAESAVGNNAARLDWVVDDLSLLSLHEPANRMQLVDGIVKAIDANPRGWNPVPTAARNRVIGPLRLMVASCGDVKENADSALSNVSFLDTAVGGYELDEQAVLATITEFVSLAILSRRVR